MKQQLRELLRGDITRYDILEEFYLPDAPEQLVRITGALTREGKEVFLRFRGESEEATRCDRCLKDFNYRHIFYYEDLVEEEDFDTFDLEELARQEYILSRPMQYVCDEDCEGICPDCGADLNEGSCHCDEEKSDARFSVLQKLLDE